MQLHSFGPLALYFEPIQRQDKACQLLLQLREEVKALYPTSLPWPFFSSSSWRGSWKFSGPVQKKVAGGHSNLARAFQKWFSVLVVKKSHKIHFLNFPRYYSNYLLYYVLELSSYDAYRILSNNVVRESKKTYFNSDLFNHHLIYVWSGKPLKKPFVSQKMQVPISKLFLLMVKLLKILQGLLKNFYPYFASIATINMDESQEKSLYATSSCPSPTQTYISIKW